MPVLSKLTPTSDDLVSVSPYVKSTGAALIPNRDGGVAAVLVPGGAREAVEQHYRCSTSASLLHCTGTAAVRAASGWCSTTGRASSGHFTHDLSGPGIVVPVSLLSGLTNIANNIL